MLMEQNEAQHQSGKGRRRVLLINPRFQLLYTLYTTSWLFPLFAIFPLLVLQLFDYLVRIAGQIDLSGPLMSDLAATRHQVFILLILAEVTFFLAVFIISLRMSHNIAGPLYKLRERMRSAAEGNIRDELHFRKADHFVDVADSFNRMLDSVRERSSEAAKGISNALTIAEKIEMELPADKRGAIKDLISEIKKSRDQVSW